MKTYLIVFFCCLTLGVKGQYNQTYFGKLAPSLNGIPKRDFGNGFHCIGTNYGALAPRFAASIIPGPPPVIIVNPNFDKLKAVSCAIL